MKGGAIPPKKKAKINPSEQSENPNIPYLRDLFFFRKDMKLLLTTLAQPTPTLTGLAQVTTWLVIEYACRTPSPTNLCVVTRP